MDKKSPSIDWEQVSLEFNYMARDEGGRGTLRNLEPVGYADGKWAHVAFNGFFRAASTKLKFVDADIFTSYEPGNVRAEESLVIRPGILKISSLGKTSLNRVVGLGKKSNEESANG